jgi:hypothetical protein
VGSGYQREKGGQEGGPGLLGRRLGNELWGQVTSVRKEGQKRKFYNIGDAGDRTPCLSHAKRALYHLSYVPMLFKCQISAKRS